MPDLNNSARMVTRGHHPTRSRPRKRTLSRPVWHASRHRGIDIAAEVGMMLLLLLLWGGGVVHATAAPTRNEAQCRAVHEIAFQQGQMIEGVVWGEAGGVGGDGTWLVGLGTAALAQAWELCVGEVLVSWVVRALYTWYWVICAQVCRTRICGGSCVIVSEV